MKKGCGKVATHPLPKAKLPNGYIEQRFQVQNVDEFFKRSAVVRERYAVKYPAEARMTR